MMMTTDFDWFVGIDWGSEKHQVCLIDANRSTVTQAAFDHSGSGLEELVQWLLDRTKVDSARVAAAIELTRGAVAETLLERGYAVFSINPKQLDRFRDRHTAAGAKDDRLDALVLADSLRT